jgi:hypothetical protein
MEARLVYLSCVVLTSDSRMGRDSAYRTTGAKLQKLEIPRSEHTGRAMKEFAADCACGLPGVDAEAILAGDRPEPANRMMLLNRRPRFANDESVSQNASIC